MVKSPAILEVTWDWRAEHLVWEGNPIDDSRFQRLGIVRPGLSDALVELVGDEWQYVRRVGVRTVAAM